MSNKKQIKNQESIPAQIKHEISAIGLILLGVFIFISIFNPKTTGVIGYWLINVGLKYIIGEFMRFLPLFLLFTAIMLFIPKIKKKRATITLILCFINFTIFYELLINKIIANYQFPPPLNGGGYIGHYGLYAIQQLVGYHGAWVLLVGTILVSIILVLNLSLIAAFKYISTLNFFDSIKKSDPLLKKCVYFLFYERRQSIIEKKIKKPKTKTTSKKQEFKLPDFDEEAATTTEEEVSQEPEEDIDLIPETLSSFKREKKTIKIVEGNFKLPPLKLLVEGKTSAINSKEAQEKRQEQGRVLEETLLSFNVKAQVVNITPGPSVTRFELKPGVGVKISKITALANDLALKLAAQDVRIEAPIPGKALVGIEVPNAITDTITLRMLLKQDSFFNQPSKLLTGMGLTINGDAIYMDLGKMPHVLIAGATGAGKSVCINTIILSILMKSTPSEVKFLMIDPKKVELSLYEGIPHLVAPVVTNPHKAAATLKEWALIEMETRYDTFAKIGVKDLAGYNNRMDELAESLKSNPEKTKEEIKTLFDMPVPEEGEISVEEYEEKIKKLPYLVVIIDELADLMMVASQEVENTICRLAQMARATGIHLVIATQRPSVNVVTGLIKANVPSRVSFFLQSQIDSRTIIDMPGAEKLLGKGDMLYLPVGAFKPRRLQGVFVSEPEVKAVVKFLKQQGGPNYDKSIEEIEPLPEAGNKESASGESEDDMYDKAKELVKSTQYASTSYLQRKLRIGYNRAARLMDELEENGVISAFDGEKKTRTVL